MPHDLTHLTQDKLNADYLHSAFIIDDNGREIPITREMIVNCCEKIAATDNQSHKIT